MSAGSFFGFIVVLGAGARDIYRAFVGFIVVLEVIARGIPPAHEIQPSQPASQLSKPPATSFSPAPPYSFIRARYARADASDTHAGI